MINIKLISYVIISYMIRCFFFLLWYNKTESSDNYWKPLIISVSGLGFGAISGGFSLMNVLAEIGGPASVGLFGQSEWFVLASSFTTCLFIFLNTAWGVMLFHAYDTKNIFLACATILLHLTCSLVVSLPFFLCLAFLYPGT